MNYYKAFFILFFIAILSSLFLTFLGTLLNYYDILEGNVFRVVQFLTPLILFFIIGIFVGRHSLKKGWLAGLKFGICFFFLCLIVHLFWKIPLNYPFYFFIISSTMIGSMLGINKKEN